MILSGTKGERGPQDDEKDGTVREESIYMTILGRNEWAGNPLVGLAVLLTDSITKQSRCGQVLGVEVT